jgi:hypothetical protein
MLNVALILLAVLAFDVVSLFVYEAFTKRDWLGAVLRSMATALMLVILFVLYQASIILNLRG